MSPYISALRAITYTVFMRFFRPTAWIAGGILLALVVLVIVLSINQSGWWLVWLIVLVPVTAIVAAVGVGLLFVARRMKPARLGKAESVQIGEFTDKITRLIEARATPPFLIGIFIAKDIVRGRKSSYIEDLLKDSGSLKGDFQKVVELFR